MNTFQIYHLLFVTGSEVVLLTFDFIFEKNFFFELFLEDAFDDTFEDALEDGFIFSGVVA